MAESPYPRPASGQVLADKLDELGTQMQALTRAVKAMKEEQERLNALLTGQIVERLAERIVDQKRTV